MSRTYPVCLKLEDKPCLVIGGGEVGLRKTQTLLEYGAKVHMITTMAHPDLQKMAEKGEITLEIRAYRQGDEAGYFLVFAATGDSAVNREIANCCNREKIWINAVDDPPHCDFYVPAVLQRGDVTVAVSTAGNSPVLAAHIRDRIAPVVPKEYGDIAALFGEIRESVNASGRPMEEKKALYRQLLEEDLVGILQTSSMEQAREKIRLCLSSWLD